MLGRHSPLIRNALPLILIGGGCHRPSELGSDNSKPVAALASPAPAAATASTTHPLTYRERLEIGELTVPPRPPSDNAKQITVWHILIAYKGAQNAAPAVTRTKDEAKALADQVDRLCRAGQDFGDLALKYSDDPAVSQNHGNLGKITRHELDKPFTDAAFALMKMETGIDPVDTAAGFQIIRRTE
jgi:hypothetical protein